MKNTVKFTLLFLLTITYQMTQAALVGSGFSYQGQLVDNNLPANGECDIFFEAFGDALGGTANASSQTFMNVMVTDGLFTIEQVDFGSITYDGKEVFVEVNVKKSINGAFTTLSPRQRISAAPYAVLSEFSSQADTSSFATSSGNASTADTATTLAAGAANNGDVLQFDGSNWVASATAGTPWTSNLSNITFTTGKVGIGTLSPTSTLQVHSEIGTDPLRIKVANATKLWVKSDGNTTVFGDLNSQSNLIVSGDTKQAPSQNGMLKYGVVISSCGGSSALSFYNGTSTAGDVTVSSTGNAGECLISFPTDVSARFWSVAVNVSGISNIGAMCEPKSGSSNDFICRSFVTSNSINGGTSGRLSLLIY